MEKSKLGISVCLLSALTFLTGYLGLTAMVLVVGYVLIREENKGLRKNAAGTLVLYLAFAALSLCIGILDNVVDLFNFGNWMYGTFMYKVTSGTIGFLNTLVYIAEKVVFGLLALFALFGKEVKIPLVNKFLEKHL